MTATILQRARAIELPQIVKDVIFLILAGALAYFLLWLRLQMMGVI